MPSQLVLVLRRAASAALSSNDLGAAQAALEQLEQEDALSVDTRGLRLDWLTRSDRLGEAQTLAAQLLTLFPSSARIHWLAGQLAAHRKDWAAAERCFRESEALHPHWRSREALGRALTQLGRFEEAEAALLSVIHEQARVRRDLAWLYERKGEFGRALRQLEDYHRDAAPTEATKAQEQRLRARLAAPADVIAEFEALLALGELSRELAPDYVRLLLTSGASAKAREFVAGHAASLDSKTLTRIAWDSYKAQAYDLAVMLFERVFGEHKGDPKFLSALEASAKRAGWVERVAEMFERAAPEDGRLYGRAKRLRAAARRE